MQDYEKLGVFYLGREYDPASKQLTNELVLYDSKDLTTHAFCVGMTGSGKTGLAITLLEEAAIDGIPAICIDPKGDLTNLALAFPNLTSKDFLSWVDPADAQRKGLPVDEYAAQTASAWRQGLADWDQPVERIARFRNAVDVVIYTPGSESGLPLSVLRSFAAPSAQVMNDPDALRERVSAVVSSVLALIGRQPDPLQGRDHILLSHVLMDAWQRGLSPDIAGLIGAVRRPPFDHVGAFDLETFYPGKERTELAMALNNLAAAPGFTAWMRGEPLEAQRLLFTAEGKPRVSILSIAHLSDAERMFLVTMVLNELIAWMRNQPGTSSLRAILMMDEIFGYFPPTANPPSKQPMLTLLKQARAYGVGCVLATQNPVDLDYKGLSNAGTWFIGRLQTEQDRARVIDGLQTALESAPGSDPASLEQWIGALDNRVFLMRNVHENAPVLFKTRWALSYLRGPLTGLEIGRLMGQHKSEAQRGARAPAITPLKTRDNAFPRPPLPEDVPEYFLTVTNGLPAESGAESITYRPMIAGTAKLHFVDAKLGLDHWRTVSCMVPLGEQGDVHWEQCQQHGDIRQFLRKEPQTEASYAPVPAPAMRAASYAAWGKSLSSYLYQSVRTHILLCEKLGMSSTPDESERDFRARLALKAREQRDAAVEELRRKYAPKFTTLDDRERRAAERLERERAQLSQQKTQTALSVGASIVRALLGRRSLSGATVDRAASAVRSAGRIGRERDDVERADENVDAARSRRAQMQEQFEADLAAIERGIDASTVPVRKVHIAPRKADIALGEIALVWTPWRRGMDGLPAPAFDMG